jgi:dTDP-4-amino-4,6-dideoxygalactose transaminase
MLPDKINSALLLRKVGGPMSEALHTNIGVDSSTASLAPIPAEDLTRQFEHIGDEVRAAIERVLPGGRYVLDHEMIGYQKRMDEIQAAILRVKLPYLRGWLVRRQQIAARYDELLADLPVITPYVAPERTHSYYLYTILAPRRDELFKYLAQRGIGSQVIYPVLVPDQGAYRARSTPALEQHPGSPFTRKPDSFTSNVP